MFGANHIINYKKNPNWSLNVMEITKGKGVDIISDCVLASNFNENIKCLANDARWLIYSTMGGVVIKEANLVNLLHKRATIHATVLRNRDVEFKNYLIHRFQEEVVPYFKKQPQGKPRLTPVVDKVFKMSQAKEAHEYMEGNTNVGKIVMVNDLH